MNTTKSRFLITLVILVTSILASNTLADAPIQYMQHEWVLQGDGNDTQEMNNLTLGVDISITDAGYIGKGATNDGARTQFGAYTEGLYTSSYPAINESNGFTYCQWVRPINLSTKWQSGAWTVVYGKRADGLYGHSLYLDDDGTVTFGMGDGSSWYTTITSLGYVNNSQWTFLCSTWNPSDGLMKVYVNGTEASYQSQATFTDYVEPGQYPIVYTATYSITTSFSSLNGTIDEITAWNTSLNDERMLWLFEDYENGLRPNCTTPTEDLSITENTVLCLGTYYLNDTGTDGVILIDSDVSRNVTLDCNGATLIGNGSGYAIKNQYSSDDYATVMNCNIQNYTNGLYTQGEYWVFYNNNLTSNYRGVFTQTYPVNINISHNTLNDNTIAIQIPNAYGADVHNNNIVGGTYGIYADNSGNSHSEIYDNVIWNTSNHAIWVQGNYSHIYGNNITGANSSSSESGIGVYWFGNIFDADNARIHDNRVSGYHYGIRVNTGSNVSIYDNFVNHSIGWSISSTANYTNISNNMIEFSEWNLIYIGGGVVNGSRDESNHHSVVHDNVMHDYWHHGIDIHNGELNTTTYNVSVFNNIIYQTLDAYQVGDRCLFLAEVSDSRFYNNTCRDLWNTSYSSMGGNGKCIGVEGGDLSWGNWVYNNSCINVTGSALYDDSFNTTYVQNYFYNTSAADEHFSIYVFGAWNMVSNVTYSQFRYNYDENKTLHIYLGNRTNITIEQDSEYILNGTSVSNQWTYATVTAVNPYNDIYKYGTGYVYANMTIQQLNFSQNLDYLITDAGCDAIPTEDYSVTTDTTFCPGTYYLNDTAGDGAITFGGNDVTLDCNGAIIIGDQTANSQGIYNNYDHTRILNCNISGFKFGIHLGNSCDYSNVTNNIVSNNTYAGIYLNKPQHGVIDNNIVYDEVRGIDTYYSPTTEGNMTLRNNSISDTSTYGLGISGSYHIIEYNNVFNTSGSFHNSVNAYDSIVKHNTFRNSSLYLRTGNNNVSLINNTFTTQQFSTPSSLNVVSGTNISIEYNTFVDTQGALRIETDANGTNDISIAHNTFNNLTAYRAIGVFNTSDVTVFNNTVDHTSQGIVVADYSNNINISDNTIKNIFTSYDHWNIGIYVSYFTSSITIEGNNLSSIASIGIGVRQTDNATIYDNTINMLSIDDKLALNSSNFTGTSYPSSIDLYSPTAGILVGTQIKGWIGDGTEDGAVQNASNYTNAYNCTNINVSGNTFGSNVQTYLYIENPYSTPSDANITHDLSSFWYRKIHLLPSMTAPMEFYNNNAFDQLSNVPKNGTEQFENFNFWRTYGCQSYFPHCDNQVINYSISKSSMNFTNVNTTDSYDVYLYNLSLIPLVDLYNFTGGSFVALDMTGEYNLTIEPSGSYVLSDFSVYTINVSIIDEATGLPFDVNGTNFTRLTIDCVDGEDDFIYYFNGTDNELYSNVSCVWGQWQFDYFYGTGNSYFRTLTPSVGNTNVTAYAVDLNTHTAVQRLLFVNDLQGVYSNSTIRIIGAVNGTDVTIEEQVVDVEKSVILYLMDQKAYKIQVISSAGVVSSIGNVLVDGAGSQTLNIPDIGFYPSESIMGGSISWGYTFNETTGVLRLQYQDASNTTESITFSVYENGPDGALLYQDTIYASNGTFTYNGVTNGTVYFTRLTIVNPYVNPINLVKYFGNAFFKPSQGWNDTQWGEIMFYVGGAILIMLLLLFSPEIGGLAAIVAASGMSFLKFMNLFEVRPEVLFIAWIIAAFGAIAWWNKK